MPQLVVGECIPSTRQVPKVRGVRNQSKHHLHPTLPHPHPPTLPTNGVTVQAEQSITKNTEPPPPSPSIESLRILDGPLAHHASLFVIFGFFFSIRGSQSIHPYNFQQAGPPKQPKRPRSASAPPTSVSGCQRFSSHCVFVAARPSRSARDHHLLSWPAYSRLSITTSFCSPSRLDDDPGVFLFYCFF